MRAAHGFSARSAFGRNVDFAQRAERAKLDAFFRADFLGLDEDHVRNDPSLLAESLALVAALRR